jgi:hypothetical protein
MAKKRAPQGLLPFEYEAEPDGDEVTARAGLPLVAEVMQQIGMPAHCAAIGIKQRQHGFSEFEMVRAAVLLMVSGGECLDDMRVLREDKALCALLGAELPSPDALRRFLEAFHDQQSVQSHPGKGAWTPRETEELRRLATVMSTLVRVVAKNEPVPLTKATIDHDATVIESHKVEARAHYKGGRGYQPVIAVWAETGLVLADEFRDGNVPAGMDNVPLIERAFEVLPESVTERYFRADSACYETSVLKWLAEPSRRIGFAISADMSRELRALCTEVPDERWTLFEQSGDAERHVTDIEFAPGIWPKDAKPLRYIAIRLTPTQRELFHDGSAVKYFAVVTNREGDAGEIIDWHRQKAGTVEHVHDVTKNELGAGVMPSGKFGANAAWYRLAMIAHDVLILMKRRVLPPEFKDARPKRLRFRVFTIAAKVIHHARGLVARVARVVLDLGGLVDGRSRGLALAPL